MKNLFPFFLLLFLLACGETTTPDTSSSINYPESLQKIFERHGGLVQWSKMQSLSYEIEREEGNEKQVVHLKDRRERIEGANFITGFDGKNFWLEADTSYQGDAVFYHNLMFYFYAMPFVLADPGIIYTEESPLEFEGQSYPGIRISYQSEVGVSPEDEYFIYYHPDTYEMAWLGYTVTYFSKEKSKKVNWIRYNDWKTFNGLLLPNSLTWYKQENGLPTEARSTRNFVKVTISANPPSTAVFQKTEKAVIVE